MIAWIEIEELVHQRHESPNPFAAFSLWGVTTPALVSLTRVFNLKEALLRLTGDIPEQQGRYRFPSATVLPVLGHPGFADDRNRFDRVAKPASIRPAILRSLGPFIRDPFVVHKDFSCDPLGSYAFSTPVNDSAIFSSDSRRLI